jgi:hypothetical protein
MGSSTSTFVLILSVSLGQAGDNKIAPEERDFQNEVFQQWWGDGLVWNFAELPNKATVSAARVPYSGYIYPDSAGGTMSALRKYDWAFHQSRQLATAFERKDTSQTERVRRTVTERYGIFGGMSRSSVITTEAVPHWYGHCNGWTSAAIRHAEPKKSVQRRGVVFTPADIKGLLAEIYMYNEMQMLAGDEEKLNPGVLHALLTNWLGRGSHPIGMEAKPGKEKWNYPIYSYGYSSNAVSPREVDVALNIAYANSSRGEYDRSPRIRAIKYFHYRLNLDEDGDIVGGWYYRDSSKIDMLWIPLSPKQGGTEGNERGNPHVNVKEVLAIWRQSISDDVRRDWVVIDPPNEVPAITSARSSRIAENQMSVFTVTAEDKDVAGTFSFVPPDELTFSLSGGADRDKFAIDAKTGELSFAEASDFEMPADADEDNVYEVEVQVDDGAGGTDTRLVRLTVTDANDNPVFASGGDPQPSENQTLVQMIAAKDEDSPAQTLKLSLGGGADQAKFSFDAETGQLTFKDAPDFERPTDADEDNVYEVEVLADDGAGGTTAQLFRVRVADGNDVPVITSEDTPEAAENQLAVVTIVSQDDDLPRQTIRCSLSGGADQDKFAIDAKTGELTFKQAPDFEKPADADNDNAYVVQVNVDDGAGGSASQLLSVAVTDANDAPAITSPNAAQAIENQLAARTVTAEDEDVQPQTLTFSLGDSADRERFSIDGKTGELTFKQPPNFEKPGDADKDNTYVVAVRVEDSAGGTALQRIEVGVTDGNDAPSFTSSDTPRASENQTAILTVTSKDEDLPSQTLQFSLNGGPDQAKLAIDAKTGELSFKQPPDFERPSDSDKNNVYEVEVKVADGVNGKALQRIQVAVADVNDNPVFTFSPKLPENQTEVLTVTASDMDMSMQLFSISISGGADRELFSIDAKTGDLAFKKGPDFENASDADKNNIYEVEIKAADGAGGSVVQLIKVRVTDVKEDPAAAADDKPRENDDQDTSAPDAPASGADS